MTKSHGASSHGRFLWYELTTTDMEAAKAFYARVLGWSARDVSMPGATYALFAAGEASVGGLMQLPQQARLLGITPHWIGYVEVDDVDAAAERIRELGGAVRVPPTDIPDVSRFAVVSDPQMAMLALFKGLKPRPDQPAALRKAGRVGWHELLAADCEAALAFYGALFGWQKGLAETDAMGTYQLFSAGGQTIGGIVTKPPTVPVPFWLFYFNVGDVDAATARVTAGGGKILNGPIEVPDGSFVVQCTDPQDAVFGLVGRRSYNAVGFLQRVAPRDQA